MAFPVDLNSTALVTSTKNVILRNLKATKLVFSVVLLILVLWFVPIDDVASNFLEFDLHVLAYSLILVFLNVALSTVRLRVLLSRASTNAPFKVVHYININSQLAGYFFSTVGQMIARNAIGSLFLDGASRFAVLTLMEKMVTAAVLFGFGLIGALIVSRSIGIVPSSVAHIGIISLAISAALVGVYVLGTTHGQRRYLRRIPRLIVKAGLERIAAVALLMNLLMLAAYTLLGAALAPEIPLYLLVAVFALVRLGALFPISFAGWGVRELSAGIAFGVIGMDPAIGVAVAICIGGLSLLALVLHFLIVHRYSIPRLRADRTDAPKKLNLHIERMVALLCGLVVPVLIGVQLRIPTESHLLSINIADPFVLVGALTFLTIWLVQLRHQRIWRIEHFNIGIICFLVMVAYGWLRGQFGYGGNHWADFNRGLGALVLMCYLFCGAMLPALLSSRFIESAVRIIPITSSIFLILYIVFGGSLESETLELLAWHPHHFNGLIGNRNALAFVLVVMICVALGFGSGRQNGWDHICLGLLLFLTVATSSRTGVICAVVAIGFGVMLGRRTLKEIAWALAIFVIANSLVYGIEFVVQNDWIRQSSVFVGDQLIGSPLHASTDRWQSYILGLAMWRDQPFIGAGLGAFIETYSDFKPRPLTIHNTALWILAEMGIVGFILFLSLPLIILRHVFRHRRFTLGAADFSLLAVLITAALFSQTHEILYQRILWFVLGMLAANKLSLSGAPRHRREVSRIPGRPQAELAMHGRDGE